MSNPATTTATSLTLDALLHTLTGTFVELVDAPAGVAVSVGSVVLADADDLLSEDFPRAGAADI